MDDADSPDAGGIMEGACRPGLALRPRHQNESADGADIRGCPARISSPRIVPLPRDGEDNALKIKTWAAGGASHGHAFPRQAKISAWPRAQEDGTAAAATLQISPADAARRQSAAWGALAGEIIQLTQPGMFAAQFCAPRHLLIAVEHGERHEGDTYVEGLARSNLRDMSRKLTFVPAGRSFREWQDPCVLPRLTCLYFDPCLFRTDGTSSGGTEPAARLFFHDSDIWVTVRKLTREIEQSGGVDRPYMEVLGFLLGRELLRLSHVPAAEKPVPGSLAGWQVKRTAAYIEAHLCARISLATLAAMVRLSPCHFARAFKQSFGMPPHRYHMSRRIERAKALLAQQALPIAWVATELGFGGAGPFSTAFRRFVGRTPSAYRRSII